jgi:uncharacterized protein (TIGR02646 family)
MIRLERPSGAPAYFRGKTVEGFRSGVKAFFERPEESRRQERPDFPLFPDKMFVQLINDLLGLSHGKCAYCESPVTSDGNASLDRYRPKAGALGLDGDYSTEHYWWLAYDWKNIHPACIKCNKFKGGKFPVDGKRARVEAKPKELALEKRLLLDPFSDQPEEHLDFLDDGTIVPRSSQGDVTITTLQLNRSDLVAARKQVAHNLHKLIRNSKLSVDVVEKAVASRHFEYSQEVGRSAWRRAPLRQITEYFEPASLWSAVAWAVLRRAGDRGQFSGADSKLHAARPALTKGRKQRKAKRTATRARTPAATPSTTPEVFGATAKERHVSAKAQQLRSRAVTRIAIHNFRGIRDLDLAIDYEPGLGAPWTILLGENATGKSSILQAVALTLLENDAEVSSAASPRQVLRKRTREGSVRVWLDESTEPRTLEFTRGSKRFRRTGPLYSSVLLGYGATRLLPRGSVRVNRGRVRLENMFDPFRPLLDANRWLGELDKKSFDYVARALKDVLNLPRSSKLKRVRRNGAPGVNLKLYGADLAPEELSDGYQSVLGVTCDIIAGLHASTSGALEAAEGLVVIDELGAHLHPRWRMRIVQSLRSAFRRVQFIASTHDPLCLRGLEDGEAVVLRRTSRGRIFPVPELPPIKGLRVDQILTSEYFGLDSTMDPVIEQKYRELYRLLALREPTPNQEARVAELQEELKPFDLPGATRRERRLLQLIDKELAQTDEEPSVEKREEIRGETDRIVADLNKLAGAAAAQA